MCLSRTDNTVSLNFDSGAFAMSSFNNYCFLNIVESFRSKISYNSFNLLFAEGFKTMSTSLWKYEMPVSMVMEH